NGQVQRVVESVKQPGGTTVSTTTDYTYDALGRLKKEEVQTSAAGGDSVTEYTLDLVGNRKRQVGTREGRAPGQTDYTHDARDRLLTEVTGSETTAYGYDANGAQATRRVNRAPQ